MSPDADADADVGRDVRDLIDGVMQELETVPDARLGGPAAPAGPVASVALTNEFRMLADEVHVLERFDRYGFDAATAMMAAQLWGRSAVQRLEDDPYALSALQPWRKVDDRARRLGIAIDDPRRLRAAVAETSKILWTRNSYDHDAGSVDEKGRPKVVDIMNGSLGIVQHATPKGAMVLFDDEASTRTEIRPVDLQRVLRGWAITVHKAQGSAFERVIIPIVPSRLLDRTMIYTAITRARRTAVLVGDVALLEQAVSAFPAAASRRQCLLS